MRIALIILVGIHGFIHLLGFLKAFGISEFNGMHQSISRVSGFFWGMEFLLFAITLVLIAIRSDLWWTFGLLASIISQILIFNHWSDAKFGTIANIIILVASLIAYSSYKFKNGIKKERIALFDQSENIQNKIVSTEDIAALPQAVQRWLNYSGVIGKPMVANVHLRQKLELKLKPEQEEWSKGTAEQYFSCQPPAFNWYLSTSIKTFLPVVGRDKFEDGEAEMRIKLFSFIPVATIKNNEKINQAALQRYLAEIVWFPSAAVSNYIQWEALDENTARASMEYMGTKGTGVFYFDEQGQFQKFIAMRYKDASDTETTEWVVSASKTEERNGIKIPTECIASWNLNSGQWTWLKLRIKAIAYNVEKMPVS